MILGGVREVYDFDHLRTWKRRFTLRDNQAIYACPSSEHLAQLGS
jgi:hypothetical protein